MKYAIVEQRDSMDRLYWESYKYGLMFRVFGTSLVNISHSYDSVEDCKTRLLNTLKNKGKYTVIQIFEV